MSVLADIALKATVVLLLAGALAVSLRRASAALRHLVWAAAVCGVLVLPAASLLLPDWHVADLPRVTPPAVERDVEESRQAETSRRIVAPDAATTSLGSLADGPPRRPSSTPLLDVSRFPVVQVWLLGALVLLAWLGVGLVRIRLLARSSDIVRDASWVDLLARLAGELGIRRPVTLRRSRVGAMPMTWGARHPVILLPAEADEWPADRRQDVLLHELAHVERHDFVSQLVARVACACYWFHPLVWVAARRLRVERERACDDRVIRHGRRASDYAGHLLDIARACSTARVVALAGVAMARRSQLADRLLDVLDAGRDRNGVPPRIAAPVWAAAALVVLPLAVMAPERADPTPPAAVPFVAPAWVATFHPETFSPETFLAPVPGRDTLRGCAGDRKTQGSSTNIHDHNGLRRTTVRLTAGRCEILLKAEGRFTFTADFTDIATVAPDGEVVVEVDGGEHERRLTVGRERVYTVDRVARPFDAEARAWLAETLTFLFRHSGLQAEERAQAILQRRGIGGLIEEIALLEGDYARRRYYQAAVASGQLDVAGWERLVTRAGQEIESDYELAQLLIDVAGRQPLTATMQAGFVEAAGTIGSDYERRRVLGAIVARDDLDRDAAGDVLESARGIDSDFELAELLVVLARRIRIDDDLRPAFEAAANTIGSSHENDRVMAALARSQGRSPERQ